MALVFPLLTLDVLVLVTTISITHVILDALLVRLPNERRESPKVFAVEHLLHVALVILLWRLFASSFTFPTPGLAGITVPTTIAPIMTSGALILAAYAFCYRGGAILVALVLKGHTPPAKTAEPSAIEVTERRARTEQEEGRRGRSVGILERMIVISLVLVGQWNAIALVLAAKSLARFDEFRDRTFAEYYLVGTLASVLIAIVAGLFVLVAI